MKAAPLIRVSSTQRKGELAPPSARRFCGGRPAVRRVCVDGPGPGCAQLTGVLPGKGSGNDPPELLPGTPTGDRSRITGAWRVAGAWSEHTDTVRGRQGC